MQAASYSMSVGSFTASSWEGMNSFFNELNADRASPSTSSSSCCSGSFTLVEPSHAPGPSVNRAVASTHSMRKGSDSAAL